MNQNWTPIKIGIYHNYVTRWLKYFRKDQMLFLNGDLLITDPYKSLKNVENFLNLKPFFQKKHFFYNAKKGFPCMLLERHEDKKYWNDDGPTKLYEAPNSSKNVKNYELFQIAFNQKFIKFIIYYF